ncbi:putative transcription factor C2H2 family [Helianthus debilis subsp. tardiflorus]
METHYISHPLFLISLPVMLLMLVALPLGASQSFKRSTPADPYDMGLNLNSTMKIIIIAVIFSLTLISLFSLFFRECLDTSSFESGLPHPLGTNRALRIKFPCGLDKKIIESFPVFPYSDVKELKIGKGCLECAVCLSEFADHERLRFLPNCHHVFHLDCIDSWLASHATCPVCRADLTVPNPDAQSELNQLQMGESGNETETETETENHNPDSIQVVQEQAAPTFPRSHSTGHSLASPGENCERYTLRLPEDVRKQIVTLKRAKSCGSGVDGNLLRGGADGDRVGRGWNFTVARMPGFTTKTGSTGNNDPGQSSSSAGFSVKNLVV